MTHAAKSLSIVVTLALLVACVGFAAWWWGTELEANAPAATAAAAADDARTVAASSPAAPALAAAAREEVSAAETAPAVPADAILVEVRVVDAVTKAPVPGADVCWSDDTTEARFHALSEGEQRRFHGDDYSERIARGLGWNARADERGVVRVHAHVGTTDVFARHDGRVGEANVMIEDARRGVVLELERELAVTVRAVDAEGRACAGVPVGIQFAAYDEQRRTDPSGQVRFGNLQPYVDSDLRGGTTGVAATAALRIPRHEGEPVPFDVLAPPAEPITLVVPPTGELHVSVVRPERKIDDFTAAWWVGEPDSYTHFEPDADGIVRLRWIPLGGVFAVRADVGDLRLERSVVGPRHPGQVVHARFEVPADAIVLAGRVLSSDGEPVANAEVDTEYSLPWVRGSSYLPTDVTGEFVWYVHERPASDEAMELEHLIVSLQRGPFDVVSGAFTPRVLRPGRNDLGDVRLVPRPLVVAGRFVFDRPATRRSISFRIERQVDGGGDWQDELDLAYSEDGDGRFAVHGNPWPGRLRIVSGRHVEPVEFERGAKDLVVPFTHGCTLSVACDLPEHGSWDSQLEIRLFAAASADPVGEPSEDARYAMAKFSALPTGSYTVEVRLRGLPDVLATERVELPTMDGDFDPVVTIDLRQRVELLRLRVAANGDEGVVGQVYAFVDQTLEGGLRAGHRVWSDETVLLVPPRAVDVTVLGANFQPALVRGARHVAEITLQRRPIVVVTVRGLPELPPDHDVSLTIAAVPRTGAAQEDPSGVRDVEDLLGHAAEHTWLDGNTTINVRAADVDRAIEVRIRNGENRLEVNAFTPKVIPAGTTPVTITFDPAEIEALIAAAKRDAKK